mgnify:CR=1 FL=1
MPRAGFYPALCMLLYPKVDVSSGIQYATAVALSLFQDKRSCDYLIFALESFPVFWTKIRENIIYTSGQLRDEQAVWVIARILQEPDNWQAKAGEGSSFFPLLEQKEEAILALGKIGWQATRTIPLLSSYADHSSARLKAYLAWTLGEIGQVQKQRTGGVKAEILIALLKLLQEKNKEVFEETTSALNKLGLPEFTHSLYLYHIGAVSLLSLKSTVRGLNELAASLNFLLTAKKRTVMAVTGDSGTGKTYFCQVLASGFSGINPEEILSLIRDSKSGQKVFNSLLGRGWLKKYIDPAYYEADGEAEPDQPCWNRFMEENSQKRLILLDGCRDRHYFQRVVDLFMNGASLMSSLILGLTSPPGVLTSKKERLPWKVFGSIFLFSKNLLSKILIFIKKEKLFFMTSKTPFLPGSTERRLGSFFQVGNSPAGKIHLSGLFCDPEEKIEAKAQEKFDLEELSFAVEEDNWPEMQHLSIFYKERLLKPSLNEDLVQEPHLLSTVFLPELRPSRIALYAQDQAAGTDETGKIFIYTLNDNRLFFSTLPQKVKNFCLLGRTFFSRKLEPN